MLFSVSICFIVLSVARGDVNDFKKSDYLDSNDGIQSQHFHVNYKSKAADHLITREINDQRHFANPSLHNDNDLYGSNVFELPGSEKVYFKYNNDVPVVEPEQRTLNVHYSNNNLGTNKQLYQEPDLVVDQAKPQFQKQENRKRVIKILTIGPKSFQLLGAPVRKQVEKPQQQQPTRFYVNEQQDQNQFVDNYAANTNNNNNEHNSGIQYDIVRLKVENVPSLAQLLTKSGTRNLMKRDDNVDSTADDDVDKNGYDKDMDLV